MDPEASGSPAVHSEAWAEFSRPSWTRSEYWQGWKGTDCWPRSEGGSRQWRGTLIGGVQSSVAALNFPGNAEHRSLVLWLRSEAWEEYVGMQQAEACRLH